MITWIQIVLQKHHKVVFSVLLFAIIIAFVFTIGQVPFLGDRNSSFDKSADFYGYDLSNQAQISSFGVYAEYEAILNGFNITTDVQYQNLILRQLYLTSLAKSMGIRQVNEADFKNYITTRYLFNKDGGFDEGAFNKFVQDRVASGRISEEVLTSIFAHNALVDKMNKLIGGPGFALPEQVFAEYKNFNASWDFSVAILNFESFKANKEDDLDKKAQDYYNLNSKKYEVGSGVEFEVAFFPASDFMPTKQYIGDAVLEEFYGANIKNYISTTDGEVKILPLSEVKDKVKTDYLTQLALKSAADKADSIAMKIYESEAKKGSAELKAILDENKVSLRKVAPIRLTDKSLPTDIPLDVARIAVRLDDNSFYSDPIVSTDGVWLVILSKALPAYIPAFDAVKNTVIADYLNVQKQEAFAKTAQDLSATLKKAVEDKQSFDDVAKKNSAEVKSVKEFSLVKPNQDANSLMSAFRVFAATLPNMKVGTVSNMQTYDNNAYIIYLKARHEADISMDSAEFKTAKQNFERSISSKTSEAVISDMISKAIIQQEQ